jgi:hypothetical protein
VAFLSLSISGLEKKVHENLLVPFAEKGEHFLRKKFEIMTSDMSQRRKTD